MPIAPVALDIAEPHRQLVDRRLNLLQTEDVGFFLRDALLQPRSASANTLHVPGRDLHACEDGGLCALTSAGSATGNSGGEFLEQSLNQVLPLDHLVAERTLFRPRDFTAQIGQVIP